VRVERLPPVPMDLKVESRSRAEKNRKRISHLVVVLTG
jgi:hypothetical protein